MADYRRLYVPGGTYFFTLVTRDRKPWLGTDAGRRIFTDALRAVREQEPFRTRAMVVLPDHLHCIWTLPPGDSDFPSRWKSIKQRCSKRLKHSGLLEGGAWQRHYWEHLIRDEADLRAHVDYIHYNPVKHGLVDAPADWGASTFHRHVAKGIYPVDWGGPVETIGLPE